MLFNQGTVCVVNLYSYFILVCFQDDAPSLGLESLYFGNENLQSVGGFLLSC